MKAKYVYTIVLALGLVGPLTSNAETIAKQTFDKDSATVRMNIAKFAKITGLNDFILTTQDVDGEAGSIYRGSDEFRVESNCAVQVDLQGESLSNEINKLKTGYALDDGGMSFSTDKGVHSNAHKVSAQAELGNISSQESGDYSAEILLTVSAIQ